MYVIISAYRAKVGEEDAIVALHEDWQRNLQPGAKGYLSGELLRNLKDSNEFISIRRFVNQESARALTNDPEEDAWHRRVVSLAVNTPMQAEYTSAWRDT